MSKNIIKRVTLRGNPNYSAKTFAELFVKLYSKNFFKKVPLAKEAYPAFITRVSSGEQVDTLMSEKNMKTLQGINEKLLKAGKEPVVNIVHIRDEDFIKANDAWVLCINTESWGSHPRHYINLRGENFVNGDFRFFSLGQSLLRRVDITVKQLLLSADFDDVITYSPLLEKIIDVHGDRLLTDILDLEEPDEYTFLTSEDVFGKRDEACEAADENV